MLQEELGFVAIVWSYGMIYWNGFRESKNFEEALCAEIEPGAAWVMAGRIHVKRMFAILGNVYSLSN